MLFKLYRHVNPSLASFCAAVILVGDFGVFCAAKRKQDTRVSERKEAGTVPESLESVVRLAQHSTEASGSSWMDMMSAVAGYYNRVRAHRGG